MTRTTETGSDHFSKSPNQVRKSGSWKLPTYPEHIQNLPCGILRCRSSTSGRGLPHKGSPPKSLYRTSKQPVLCMARALLCMNSLVPDKVTLSAKGFPTFIALVRSFSSVDFFVSSEVTSLAEGFLTFRALIRPTCTVKVLVLNQSRLLT